MEEKILSYIYTAISDGLLDTPDLLFFIIMILGAISYYYLSPIYKKIINSKDTEDVLVKLSYIEQSISRIENRLDASNIKNDSINDQVKDVNNELMFIKGILTGFRNKAL